MRHLVKTTGQKTSARSRLAELAALALALGVLLLLELPLAGGTLAQASTRVAATELLQYRTASSRTYDNHDGTFRTALYSGRVHYRNAQGDWQPISSELVATDEPGYAWQNEANSFHAYFASQLGDDFLQLAPGERSFLFSLQDGAHVSAQTRARGLTYPNVFPGVDLRYDLRPDGVKEQLLLANAQVPLTYHFLLRSPLGRHVHAARRPDGSWSFYLAPHARPAFVLDAPWVGELGSLEPDLPHASLDVTRQGEDFRVDLSLDPEWLLDPLRRFPVEVDPTISIRPDFQDASFNFLCSTCTGITDQRLSIGTTSAGLTPQTWRSGLQFTLSDIPAGASISAATLKLYFDGTCLTPPVTCGGVAHQIDALKMTGSWSPSSRVNQLAFNTTPLASFTLPAGASPQWMSWNLTSTVQSWLSGSLPNFGLLLKRSSEPTNVSGPRPPSRNYPAEPTLGPTLEVTYNGDGGTLLDPDTLHANGAELHWIPYSGPGAPPFQSYEVHRSTSASFTPSATTRLTTITDAGITSYRDTTAKAAGTFTYKVLRNGVEMNRQTVTLPAAGQASKLLRPDPNSGMDTFITQRSDSTDCTNHGALDHLQLGTDTVSIWRPLLRFDLSEIPSSATVSAATLSLWHPNAPTTALTINAHRLTTNWDAGTGTDSCTGDGATWYETTGGVRWDADGADFDATASASASIAANADPGWTSWALTSLAQDWVSGNKPNEGLLLKLSDETRVAGKSVNLYAADFAVAPTLRPKLAVTYSETSPTIAPTVAISKPVAGELVSGTTTISAGAFDDRRVDSVQFFVDGNSIGTDSSEPFSVSWNSSSVSNANHSLTARATDDAGNQTTSAAVSVTVGNSAAPTTSITAPANNATVSGTVTVNANASDDVAVTKVEFYADSALLATDTTAPYSSPWNTLDPALPAYDGQHALTTKAYDAHAHITTSATVTVTVANASGSKYIGDLSSSNLPARVEYDPGAGQQQSYPVDITLTNRSGQLWSGSSIVLRYRWYAAGSSTSLVDSTNTTIPDVAPGGSTIAHVSVAPPTLPDGIARGYYRLRFDLYDQATSSWFAAHGNKPLETDLNADNPHLAPKLGLEPYYSYDSEQLGPHMQNFVNVADGNSVIRWRPLSAPGIGISTVVQLTYNSTDDAQGNCPAEVCPAGDGWSLAISSLTRFGHNQFHQEGNKLVLVDGDGSEQQFTLSGGQWTAPNGVHLYLRQVNDPNEPGAAWALTRPDRLTYYYSDQGDPLSVKDKNGNHLRFVLEGPTGNKRVAQVVDQPLPGQSQGRIFQLTYVAGGPENNRLQEISDHSGHKLVFGYGEHANHTRLETVTEKGGTNADGSPLVDRTFRFSYGTNNDEPQLSAVTDPRGHATGFTYYATHPDEDKLHIRTNRETKPTSFSYGSNTTSVTAPLSRTTTYHLLADATNDGSVDSITNPAGEQTQIVWNDVAPFRQVKKLIEPSGKYRQFAYNANGLVTDIWDQLQPPNNTHFTYLDLQADAADTRNSISLLHTFRDPKLNVWTFNYDANNINLTDIFDPLDQVNAYQHFDYYAAGGPEPPGVLQQAFDANNNKTSYSNYDANGFPQTVTDAKGQITRYVYDENGLLHSVQDARHQLDVGTSEREFKTVFDYDSFHRLGRESTPTSTATDRGNLIWTSVGYDPNDNVVALNQPGYRAPGFQSTFTYDFMDRRKSATDPEGNTTGFSYDDAGRLSRTTLPRGYSTPAADDFVTENVYDSVDRVVTRIQYSNDASPARKTHFCFERNTGDLLWLTAPRAALGSPPDCNAQNAQPPPYTTRYTYDFAHKLKSVTEPLDTPTGKTRTRSVTYDANGNVTALTRQIDPNRADAQTSFTYTARDELEKTIETFSSPTGRTLTTKNVYDRAGNLLYQVLPRAWDAAGGQDPGTDGNYVTAYRYDKLNQLDRIALPKDASFHRTYVHRQYDPDGNLTLTTLPVAQAEYDPNQVPAKQRTALTYFDPGWIASSDDHVNPVVHYDYTAEGWQGTRHACSTSPTVCTDHRETYFRNGLLHERKLARDGSRGGSERVTYGYDGDGNLTSGDERTDETYTLAADYNGFDEPTESRQHRAADALSYTDYTYDANANIAGRWDDGSSAQQGRRHDFTYDESDQLTVDHDWGPDHIQNNSDDQQTKFDYFLAGWDKQRLVQRNATGWLTKLQTDRDYFDNGDLKTLTTRNASVPVETHTLSYLQCPDGTQSCAEASKLYMNDNRTQDVFTLNGPSGNTTRCETSCTTSYRYGPRDNLTWEDAPWRSPAETNIWTYDDALNVVQSTVQGTTQQYVYDGNQLQQLKNASGSVLAHYYYDIDGNLACVTDGTETSALDCRTTFGAVNAGSLLEHYSWDFLGRLERYERFGASPASASYRYDPLDRLVSETSTVNGQASKTSCFSYIGLSGATSAETRVPSPQNGPPNCSQTPTFTKSYAYDADLERTSVTVSGTGPENGDFYFGRSVHGDVSLLLRNDGSRIATYGYRPYGQDDSGLSKGDGDPSDPFNPYRFNDDRIDPASGSEAMGARRYGTGLGRFLQQDSFLGAGTDLGLSLDPLNLNRYAFAAGNPTNLIDLSGHEVYSSGDAEWFRNNTGKHAGGSGQRTDWDRQEEAWDKRAVRPVRTLTAAGRPRDIFADRLNDRWAGSAQGCIEGEFRARNPSCGEEPLSAKWRPSPACQSKSYCPAAHANNWRLLLQAGVFLLSLRAHADVVRGEAVEEEIGLARYGEGGGHHIPAKAAFRGAANYDLDEALAIPNEELARLNLNHGVITGAQARLYSQFARSNETLTWSASRSIETQALEAAGASPGAAQSVVERAIEALRAAGVPGPTRIPWGR
jgi:RHS repeat-associated protein